MHRKFFNRHVIQTIHLHAPLVKFRCLHIIICLQAVLEHCGFMNTLVIQHQYLLLQRVVNHVCFVSFQQLVPGFALQLITKKKYLLLQISKDRQYIANDTYIFETKLVILWIWVHCILISIVQRIAKFWIEPFCSFLSALLYCINLIFEPHFIDLSERFDGDMELLIRFLFAAELRSRPVDLDTSSIPLHAF